MRTVHRCQIVVLGSLLVGLLLPAALLAARHGDDGRSTAEILERLRLEEREREEARAAAAAEEEAELERRQRELEQERERAAIAAREAQAAFERRRAAMETWHRSFTATLAPLLDARERLYRRLPYRMFAAVRPACVAFAEAVDPAASGYREAPDRLVEALARDLFTVYRESASHCVEGAYFSFTVREGQVRRIVSELIAALAPYGLAFPSTAPGTREENVGSAPARQAGSTSAWGARRPRARFLTRRYRALPCTRPRRSRHWKPRSHLGNALIVIGSTPA
jgi:hypothetical protein